MFEKVLIAIMPAVAQLIQTILADDYDQEKELQAMLHLQRVAADLRVKKLLDDRK